MPDGEEKQALPPQPEEEGGAAADEEEEVSCIIEPHAAAAPHPKKKYTFWGVFRRLFVRHGKEDVARLLTSGTPAAAAETRPPEAWLFARIFFILLVVFFGLFFAVEYAGSVYAVPAFVTIGSAAVPVTLTVFFFEIDSHRDVSAFTVLKAFFFGGLVGGASSLFADWLADPDYVGALLQGIPVEVVKIFVIFICIRRYGAKGVLSGLLIGAAVGAGFAAVSASGNAFRRMFVEVTGEPFGRTVEAVVIDRAMIAEGVRRVLAEAPLAFVLESAANVAWGAIAGGALLLVDNSRRGGNESIKSFFLLLFLPILFHAAWNMPFVNEVLPEILFMRLVFCLIAWYATVEIVNFALGGMRFDEPEKPKKEE